MYQSLSTEFNDSAVQNLFAIGKAAYDARDWDKALTYFAKCLEKQPDYPEVIFYTGVCYQNKSDWPTAVEYYNQLINNPSYSSTVWGQQAAAQRGY